MSDEADLQLALGGALLTFELFEKLNATTDRNIFISPFSIQTCMALAFAGAKGYTAEEISTFMNFSSNSAAEVAATFRHVLEQYKDSEFLKFANKIYLQAGQTIKAEYAVVTKEQYHAGAETINFADSVAATKAINAWVARKTAGKITDLIPSGVLGADTCSVLLNAMHFKGEWQLQFEERETQEGPFWVTPEESVNTMFMCQKAEFRYGHFSDPNCQCLEMSYSDSDLSMFVLLPKRGESLQSMIEVMKEVNLMDLSEGMSDTELLVVFPKFKMQYSIELSKVLQELGIKKAFGGAADFSNILESTKNMFISEVFHQATIDVNEVGTEAAAGTASTMKLRCRPLTFKADRPFIYWIWNKKNVLFAGTFVNPLTKH